MRFDKQDLDWAAGEGHMTAEQADALWAALQTRRTERPHFSAVHIAYFAGALLVIGAMGWFMGTAWEALGGAGIFAISVVYAAGFTVVGRRQWNRPGGRVLGGLLIAVAVAMTPLATYGLQRWLGIWHGDDPGNYRDFHVWIRSGWFTMELATVGAGLLALRYVRFPFLCAPVAFALWYMSMDLTPIIAGGDFDWHLRKLVSVWFGLAMIAGSYLIDRRTTEDFAFWGYLFGLIAFWGGLSLMSSDSELSRFFYFAINVALIFAAVFLRRRAFLVFGALGCCGYIGYLAGDLFEDSFLFPFVLTGFGIAIIGLGVVLKRHGARFEQAVIDGLPPALRRLRPAERDH